MWIFSLIWLNKYPSSIVISWIHFSKRSNNFWCFSIFFKSLFSFTLLLFIKVVRRSSRKQVKLKQIMLLKVELEPLFKNLIFRTPAHQSCFDKINQCERLFLLLTISGINVECSSCASPRLIFLWSYWLHWRNFFILE